MKTINHMLILMGSVLFTSLAQGQVVLEALDQAVFTATATRSYTSTRTRDNCPPNHTGSSVSYTATATATATSYESYNDAYDIASNQAYHDAYVEAVAYSQTHANANGTCTPRGYRCTKTTRVTVSLRNWVSFFINNDGPCSAIENTDTTTYNSNHDESGFYSTPNLGAGKCWEDGGTAIGSTIYYDYTKSQTITINCVPN